MMSCISLYLTVLINKILISIFDDNISKKKFLYIIAGICIFASIVSIVLFFIHSIPIQKLNIEENKKDFEEKKNIVDKGTQTNIKKDKYKKKIKAFTLCGYLFFGKSNNNEEDICVCFKYSGKKEWFYKNICKPENIVIVLAEILFQLQAIGFKTILSEKMLESFSDWKSIKFIFYDLSFTILLRILILPIYAEVASSLKEKERIIIMILFFIYIFYGLFSIYNFIISLIYYLRGGINDYLIMVDFIIFKILEFHLFSFFGIFNSDNILDGSLLLNLERANWIIIENLLDNFNAKKKTNFSTNNCIFSNTSRNRYICG